MFLWWQKLLFHSEKIAPFLDLQADLLWNFGTAIGIQSSYLGWKNGWFPLEFGRCLMFDFKESLKTSTIFGGGSKLIWVESIWISFGQVEIRRKRQACDHFDPRSFTPMKLQNLLFKGGRTSPIGDAHFKILYTFCHPYICMGKLPCSMRNTSPNGGCCLWYLYFTCSRNTCSICCPTSRSVGLRTLANICALKLLHVNLVR